MRWQVQEAKQRFSELLRRAQKDGPQAVTKHGREVAYVVDVAWYHEKAGLAFDLRHHLLHGPATDTFADLVDSAHDEEPTSDRDPITDLVEELTITDNQT